MAKRKAGRTRKILTNRKGGAIIFDDEKLYSLLKFFVRLNICALPLYAILFSGYQSSTLMELTTGLAFGLIQLTGMQAELTGGTISIPVENGYWGAYVSWDSIGWKSILAFLALVCATEFPLKKKLRAAIFIPVIYAANVTRIWFMFFAVSRFGISVFPLLHITVWSWGLIALVLALWVIWMKRL